MPDDQTVVVGAYYENNESGAVRIYTLVNNTWIQKGSTLNGQFGERFGSNVAMPNANTISAVATANFANEPYVKIYTWNGSDWIAKGNKIAGITNTQFDGTLSMPDENTVAFSGMPAGVGGTVWVYRWNGSDWTPKGPAFACDSNSCYNINSVHMPNSETIAIANSVKTAIFTWNGSNWIQKGTDLLPDLNPNDLYGLTAHMPNPNMIGIGDFWHDGIGIESGHVKVYYWNGNGWIQKGNDIDGEAEYNRFGCSVSMPDSNTIAIGAYDGDTPPMYNNGNIRVFEWNGNDWQLKGTKINGLEANGGAGSSVSMPTINTFVEGEPSVGQNNGAVRVFSFSLAETEDITNYLNLRATPNPTRDKAFVDLQPFRSYTIITIRDIHGRLLNTLQLPNTNNAMLDLSYYENGTYILHFVDAESHYSTLRIIKN
jgi:hypothetical protein